LLRVGNSAVEKKNDPYTFGEEKGEKGRTQLCERKRKKEKKKKEKDLRYNQLRDLGKRMR